MQTDVTSITGTVGGAYPDGITLNNTVVATALATPGAIQTGTTAANTVLLQAYDVDGTTYKTFATLTANNTPTLAIAAPSGGTVAIDGAVIGGTTPLAGHFTTLGCSGTLAAAAAATVGTTLGVTGAATLSGNVIPGANAKSMPLGATVTHAAGATNSIDVTITMKDGSGTTLAKLQPVEVYITDDSAGAGPLSVASLSGALSASTGNILTALTAKLHVKAITASSGVLVLNLIASGKPAGLYFNVVIPATGQIITSAASGTDWGA